MSGRIGLGAHGPVRSGEGAERFVAPRSLHPGALWLAFAAPLTATLALLALRFAG